MLVDDAFDLSAVNLADLPFGAYFNVTETVVPVTPGRPSRGGYLQVFPPHRRRRRTRPLLHVHVAAGGVAVGGAADILIINPRAADMAQARAEDELWLLDLM